MVKNLRATKFLIKQNLKLKKRVTELERIVSEKTKEIYTPNEVREIYGISRKTFDRYRLNGLKVIQPKRGGKILVKRSEIEKFLNT